MEAAKPTLYVSKMCPHSREILILMRQNQQFSDNVDTRYVEEMEYLPDIVDRVPLLVCGDQAIADEKLFDIVNGTLQQAKKNDDDAGAREGQIAPATGVFDTYSTDFETLDGSCPGTLNNNWCVDKSYPIKLEGAQPMPKADA